MVRVKVQAVDVLEWTEHDGQLQLCVPLVITEGGSHRLAEAMAGKGVLPLSDPEPPKP